MRDHLRDRGLSTLEASQSSPAFRPWRRFTFDGGVLAYYLRLDHTEG